MASALLSFTIGAVQSLTLKIWNKNHFSQIEIAKVCKQKREEGTLIHDMLKGILLSQRLQFTSATMKS